jgi:glycosyltransferase involved in cell wall biosynthesis
VLDELTRLESQNVVFLGRINNADLCAVMHRHDLVVVPSIYENFGNVSIEAQAAGLPVLVSRTGGLKDTIIEGETGFSFIAGDRGDLLQALTQIAALERSELQRLGSTAAKRARELYDWAHVASAYETTFRIAMSASSK